jgi:hypothetical protein
MEKVCISCKLTAPIFDFYKHPMMADGHLNKCKTCCKKHANEHRANNLEAVRAYDRSRSMLPHRVAARDLYQQTDAGKLAHQQANKRWQELQPIRRAANLILGRAVKNRRIIKPNLCQAQDCTETKLEAHHPDYDRPLDVVWLCNKHHRECHKLAKVIQP